MVGSATFTMLKSSWSTNCAPQMSTIASPDPRTALAGVVTDTARRMLASTKHASLEPVSLGALVSFGGVVGQQRGHGDLSLGCGGQDGGQPGNRG